MRILLEKIHSNLTHITKRHEFAFISIDRGDCLIEHSGPASGSHLDIPLFTFHLSPREEGYPAAHQLDNYCAVGSRRWLAFVLVAQICYILKQTGHSLGFSKCLQIEIIAIDDRNVHMLVASIVHCPHRNDTFS